MIQRIIENILSLEENIENAIYNLEKSIADIDDLLNYLPNNDFNDSSEFEKEIKNLISSLSKSIDFLNGDKECVKKIINNTDY